MGNFTLFNFNARIKAPKKIIKFLHYTILGKKYERSELPSHEFFDNDSWYSLFIGKSYSIGNNVNHIRLKYDDPVDNYIFFIYSQFKNYNNLIQKFLDWILPYIEKEWNNRGILGFYENDFEESINLLLFKNNKIIEKKVLV